MLQERKAQIGQSQTDGFKTRFTEAVSKPKEKSRREVVLWDDIAVNEDRSNDPRYKRTKAERATLWSVSQIVSADKSGLEYSLASRTIREQSH